jgi:hypothetical protein
MAFRISKYLFLGLIATLPIFRPSLLQYYSQIPVADILFLLSAAVLSIAVLTRKFRPVFDRSLVFMACFAAALAISAAFSPDRTKSAIKLLGHFYLIGLAMLAIQFAAADEGFLRQAVRAWIVGLALALLSVGAGFVWFFAGYTTLQDNYFLYHFGTLPSGNYPRIRGLFANPNMFCTYLAVSMPILLSAIRANWIGRNPGFTLLAGLCAASLFTISPGIGGVVLAAAIWMIVVYGEQISRGLKIGIAAVSVIAAVGFFVSSAITLDTQNPVTELRIPGTFIVIEPAVRVLTWESSIRTFVASPLIGRGTGMDAAWVPYTPLAGPNQLLLDAHNVWLSIAAQTGMVGVAAFCLLMWHLWNRTRFRIEANPCELELLHVALSCALVGGFLYQSLTGAFEDARHVWVMFGLLAAANSAVKGIEKKEEN